MIWVLSVVSWADPLARGACGCFVGEAHGNDDVVMTVRLCRDRDGLEGLFHWDGSRSGTSVRALAGERTPGGVRLRDTTIRVDRPNPGWRFCPVDGYELRWTAAGGLSGTYRSAGCFDDATI